MTDPKHEPSAPYGVTGATASTSDKPPSMPVEQASPEMAETPATPHNPGLGPVPSDPAGKSAGGAAPPADAELPSDVEPDPSQQPT